MDEFKQYKEQSEFCSSHYKRIGIFQIEKQCTSLENVKECKEIEKKSEQILANLAKNDLEKYGFEVIRYVAKGAQGRVFLARNRQTKIRYAFKCIEKEEIETIENEIKTMQLFKNSPFVINYIHHFVGDNFVCIQMQECKGTLEELLQQNKQNNASFNENTVIKLATEILFGLMDVHSKNIIICDMKPENILIDYNGRAIISDFGLAKELKFDKSQTIQKYGNLFYRAPEAVEMNQEKYDSLHIQIGLDQLSKRADLFSFALIIYRMIVTEQHFSKRFIYQECNIDASQQLRNFKHKEQFTNLIKKLTSFDPKQRLGHLEVFSILYALYNQEISIDNCQLSTSCFQNKPLPNEVSELISCNSNYVIPVISSTQQLNSSSSSVQQQNVSNKQLGNNNQNNNNYQFNFSANQGAQNNQIGFSQPTYQNQNTNFGQNQQSSNYNNTQYNQQSQNPYNNSQQAQNYPLNQYSQNQYPPNQQAQNQYPPYQQQIQNQPAQNVPQNYNQNVMNQQQNNNSVQQANKQQTISRTKEFYRNVLNRNDYQHNQNIIDLYNLVENSQIDLMRVEDIARKIFKNDLELNYYFSLQNYKNLMNRPIEIKSDGIFTENYIVYFSPPLILIREHSLKKFEGFGKVNNVYIQKSEQSGVFMTNDKTFEIALAFIDIIIRSVFKQKPNLQ